LYVSYNRGVTWNGRGNIGSGPVRQILLSPSDTTMIFSAAFGGGLRRSADYGLTWNIVLPNYGIDGESITFLTLHPDTMYAGNFSDGAVYRSTNRGTTWLLRGTAGSMLCALSVRPDSTNILYAATGNGDLSKSTDGGTSWRIVLSISTAEIPDIVINPVNPMVAYGAGFSGGNTDWGVWKTTDGGEVWSKTSLQGISVWSLAIDHNHPNTVYAGAFSDPRPAVFKTSDGGTTWDTLRAGYPAGGDSWSLKVHPLDPNVLWLSISGSLSSGVFRWSTSTTEIRGAVLDTTTNDTVRNGTVRITATGDSVNLSGSSGLFSFHYFEGDPSLAPTVSVQAYPYFTSGQQLSFSLDSVVDQNLSLQKLTFCSVHGTIRDSITLQPISAKLTLFSTTSIGPALFTHITDGNGDFNWDSVFISYPPVLRYDKLEISPQFPYRQMRIAPLTLDTAGLAINFRPGIADIMITSPVGSGNYSDFYTNALDSLGLTHYVWDQDRQGPAPLSRANEVQKNTLVYFTGVDSVTLTNAELDSLTACVNAGCNLFVTGQNFVEKNNSSAFVTEYIGVSFAGNSTIVTVRGVTGDLFSGATLSTFSPPLETSRDSLRINNPRVHDILRYGTVSLLGVAGVRLDSIGSGGKLILFGFGFQAISSASTRRAVMQRVIGYFDGSIIVGVEVNPSFSLPTIYSLKQNFPNPFNPTTMIEYTLPQPGFVSVKIYDVLGQEVAMLVNETKTAGKYTAEWRANAIASGIYFCRMQAGTFAASRKLLLLK
jgi:hypothetical protein